MKPRVTQMGERFWIPMLTLVVMAGCVSQPSATNRSQAISFDMAVATATDDLMAQTQRMPAFLGKIESQLSKGVIVVDPMLDGVTGQQTVVSQLMEQKVTERVRARYPQFQVLPLDFGSLPNAQYVLIGMISREPGGGTAASTFQISLALVDLKSAKVAAQAGARSRDDGLDTNPTPFYRDSPVITRDMIVDGYIRTSTTAPGSAADQAYLQQMSLSALLTNALRAYNEGRYGDAVSLYQQAAGRPDGQQLRVLSGVYLAHWQLGQTAEAEQAFAKIVGRGLASNSLNIKFLFKPNTTEFPADPTSAAPIPSGCGRSPGRPEPAASA